jgi:hypothetical protein
MRLRWHSSFFGQYRRLLPILNEVCTEMCTAFRGPAFCSWPLNKTPLPEPFRRVLGPILRSGGVFYASARFRLSREILPPSSLSAG